MTRNRADCSAGFTLLEALVVMAVLGTLAALSAPSLMALREKHQMQSQGELFLSSLQLARSQALQRQKRVTVCLRDAGDVCTSQGSWAQGWVMFVDDNGNAVLDGQEQRLQVQGPAPAFLRMTGNTPVRRYVSYGPEGRSQSVSGALLFGTLRLCKPGQSAAWELVINAVGKPRLEAVLLSAAEAEAC